MKKLVAVFVCFLLVICPTQAKIYDATHASNLEADLAKNYHTFNRPSDITDVYIRFGLSHITKLDIVDQQFHVNGFLMISWYDPRLRWKPIDYGNMTQTYIKASNIWMPPIVLNNAASTMEIIGDKDELANVPVILYSFGIVNWLAPTSFVAQCTINIRFYPFDIKTCHLLVTPWLYSSKEINIKINEYTDIATELYEENGEWDLIDTHIELATRPVIFLALVGAFVFMLPIECGAKIVFGLNTLLSLSIVMTIVSDSIPPVSSSTCILSVYLLTTYIVCTIEVLITVMNIRIHNMTQLGYKPSTTMQSFIGRFLMKIAHYEAGDIVKNEKKTNTPQSFSSSQACLSVSPITNEKMTEAAGVKQAWEPEMQDDNEAENETIYTYQDVSIMLDKICFVFFLILTIFLTLLFLLVLIVGGGQSV